MSFNSNITITKSLPAVIFDASEELSAYHEDHEIDGALWRVRNATYKETPPQQWSSVDHTQPSYATVQNTDGSTSYFSMGATSSPWTSWAGSGNNAVFNGIDFGMTTESGVDNTAALQSAITAVHQAGGGTIFIPAGTYFFTNSTGITIAPTQSLPAVGIIIAGTSGQTKLVQSSGDPVTLFTVSDWVAPGNIGVGLRFQDLIIVFTGSPTAASGAQAINVAGSQNVTATRVLFADCPQAMYLDHRSLQCGLFQCAINYDQGPSTQTMIFMGGSENYVESCVISQTAKGTVPAPPGDCTGINIQSGGGGMYITNTQISDFDYGISITGGGVNLVAGFISNVHCEANVTAVQIQPSDSNETVYQVFFNNCDFALTTIGSTGASPGILISLAKGGSIADIFFTNCMCHNWAGPGLQIDGGQNISVIGGRFAANATSLATSGGIAVTGSAQYVTIIGADCYGKIPNYGSEPPPTNPIQPYGISVTGAVVAMRVRGCNLNGNASGALYAPTPNTDLQVTDCTGYNDARPTITTTAPGDNVPFTAATYGYYGRVAFYVHGGVGTLVAIDNNATNLTSGGFTLDPGEIAAINYTTAPSFVMVGK